ncbi:MAG: YwqI/YxiC family protein [Proteobacteria bacterium]|nr:YwqI/YxiC family protein [Pseudomonadota bacterium]
MTSLEQKKDLILKHEEGFAFFLAREVLKAPKFTIWMILVPIIIVYFMYQNRKVMDGRKGFVQNYLVSRRRALEESFAHLEKGRRPDIDLILTESDLPGEARGPFKELFSLLVDHYEDLLRSDGEDMASLIRSTYKNRMNYLLFVNRLNQVEKALNTALRSYMVKNMDEVHDVMKTMERVSEMLRRENALRIFG